MISTTPDILMNALAIRGAGVSIVPIDHQTKRPLNRLLPRDDNRKPVWKPFQTAIADEAIVRAWFSGGAESFAVVGGAVSGGLLILDFDVARLYQQWQVDVGDLAEGLPVQRTGGGGYQVFCRCSSPGENAKLAWVECETEESGREIAIETRGEGGYAVVPPSLHPDGTRYEMISGELAEIPMIAQARADALIAAARKLDEAPFTRQEKERIERDAVAAHQRRTAASRNGSANVIGQFNEAHPIDALLESHGYTRLGDRFVRPGGKSPSVSVKDGRSVHFSSNDPLNDGKVKSDIGIHDAFDVFAHFEHGGDVKAAVKAAARAMGIKGGGVRDGGHTAGDAGGQAQSIDEGFVALGQRDPATGRLVLSPRKTLPTAEAFIADFHHHADGRTLHSYAGTILVWHGNRFIEIEEESLRQKMQPWLHSAMRYVLNKKTGELELVDFESNPTTIKAAIESLKAHTHLPASITPPAWLTTKDDQPDPRDLLPCLSGNLHISTGQMLTPSPALFNINALDFDYDPQAEAPERWIKFLEQLWGDDLESVELLQEWMGYCLVADTSLQKMLLLVGPRRSGKGTIGRIITKLVGAGNVVGPTTSSLSGGFGLQPLIGKSLAIVSDARFSGENIGVVVERLLCISGEDTLTVDRKFLGSVTMRLPTRFMFLTNELPRMNDSSAALAGRFVILRLTNSFYGQEDPTLTSQLTEELPGILLWALDGLKRLRTRGHFVMPQSVAEAVQELEDLASPVLAFVRDRCVIKVGTRVWVDNLYAAWKSWCEQDGRTIVTNKQTFGRDLAAAVAGVVRRRGAGDVPFYDGISLKEFGL